MRLYIPLFFTLFTGFLPVAANAEDWRTKNESRGNLKGLGQGYFNEFCAPCHGQNAEGVGPAGVNLTPPPADLREIAKRRKGVFPTAEIEKIIDGREVISAHGPREMPVWGRVFSAKVGGGSLGEELNAGYVAGLVEYLRSVQK